MATIALYAVKMNQMPSLIGEVKKSVGDYSSELFSLKSKALNIRKSVCDLDDVIGMVQTSTQIPGAEDGVPGEDPSENRRIHG